MSSVAPQYSLTGKKVWVAGHRGMLGLALLRRLDRENCEILTVDRSELDLRHQAQTSKWVSASRPQIVIVAAAKVGGILANASQPSDFLYDNLMVAANVIHAAHSAGVDRLLFIGSSCIYPKLASQPIEETCLLTGALEPTNEWYAIAKIAGVKLAQAYRRQHGRDFISAMPTNLYGPHDNFDLNSGHVAAALLRKAHDAKVSGAKEIVVWGTGSPRREFLHVDDCADACVHLLQRYSDPDPINVGFGDDVSILDLTRLICEVVGYTGAIVHDLSKPDGTPRKLLSSAKLRGQGWKPAIDLRSGLESTYAWFLDQARVFARS